MKEIKEFHIELQLQLQTVKEEILNAIDRNNYPLCYELVIERKQILLVIEAVETIIESTRRRRLSSISISTVSAKLGNY